jgi:hypothetical protein
MLTPRGGVGQRVGIWSIRWSHGSGFGLILFSKWPEGGDFWQINTDLRRYTEETWANFWTNWRLGTSSSLAVSRVVFTRNIEIFGQEINTYKPFYNYINIDLYLYVKSSHYVLIKTRVGVFYQIYNARRSRAFYVW